MSKTLIHLLNVPDDYTVEWFPHAPHPHPRYVITHNGHSDSFRYAADAQRFVDRESRLALAEELHKQADHFLKYRDNAADLGNALKAFEQSGRGRDE